MKKAFLSIAILLATLYVFGQSNERSSKTPEERAEMATERLEEALELTEEQTEEIFQINLEAAKKASEVRESRKGLEKTKENRIAARQELKAINEDRDSKIQLVLREDQMAAYEQVKKESQERRKERVAEIKNRRKARNTEDNDDNEDEDDQY